MYRKTKQTKFHRHFGQLHVQISECCVKEIITKVKLGSDEESNKNHMFDLAVCLFVCLFWCRCHTRTSPKSAALSPRTKKQIFCLLCKCVNHHTRLDYTFI